MDITEAHLEATSRWANRFNDPVAYAEWIINGVDPRKSTPLPGARLVATVVGASTIALGVVSPDAAGATGGPSRANEATTLVVDTAAPQLQGPTQFGEADTTRYTAPLPNSLGLPTDIVAAPLPASTEQTQPTPGLAELAQAAAPVVPAGDTTTDFGLAGTDMGLRTPEGARAAAIQEEASSGFFADNQQAPEMRPISTSAPVLQEPTRFGEAPVQNFVRQATGSILPLQVARPTTFGAEAAQAQQTETALPEGVTAEALAILAERTERQAVIDLVTTQVGVSEDSNIPQDRYSGGEDRAWCFDMISWAFNEKGDPITGEPNQGVEDGWRIPWTVDALERLRNEPGTRVYTIDQIRAGEYVPDTADIIFYQYPRNDNEVNHASLVRTYENGTLHTTDGNWQDKVTERAVPIDNPNLRFVVDRYADDTLPAPAAPAPETPAPEAPAAQTPPLQGLQAPTRFGDVDERRYVKQSVGVILPMGSPDGLIPPTTFAPETSPTPAPAPATVETTHPLIDLSTREPATNGDGAPIEIVRVGGGDHVDVRYATSLAQIIEEAGAAGHEIFVYSGGRSRDEQIALRREHCGTSNYAIFEMPSGQCSPPTAIPGTSNHEDFAAVDFRSGTPENGRPLTDGAAAWLKEHADERGWENLPSEQWHYDARAGAVQPLTVATPTPAPAPTPAAPTPAPALPTETLQAPIQFGEAPVGQFVRQSAGPVLPIPAQTNQAPTTFGAPEQPEQPAPAPEAPAPAPAASRPYDKDWASVIPDGPGTPYPTPEDEAAFMAHTADMSADLGIDPDHMMGTFKFETGSTFDPAKKNPQPNSSASGFIQMVRSTAEGYGLTPEEIRAMSPIEQLDRVVRPYFEPSAGQLPRLDDVYLKVFTPSLIGTPLDHPAYTAGSQEYEMNDGFDRDENGVITTGEITQTVHDSYNQVPDLPPA